MNSEPEKNDSRTEPIASAQAKRAWHTPEIEEVDFAETESGPNTHDDGLGNSFS